MSFQQEIYIKEEVMISDMSDFSDNEASNKVVSTFGDSNEHDLVICTKCSGRYKGMKSLRNHQRLCGLAAFLKCDFCDFKTKYKYNLKKHLNNTHKNLTAEEIQEILTRARKRENKFIGNASKSVNTKDEAASSSKTLSCKDFIKLYCPKCDTTFEKIYSKDRKCRRCGTIAYSECSKCSRRYASRNGIYCHLLSKCCPKRHYQCADCDYQTTSKFNLTTHVVRLHVSVASEDYEMCGKCGKPFKNRINRQNHESLCGKEPNLQCEFCPFRSKHKRSFNKHVQNHILYPKIKEVTINENSRDTTTNSAGIEIIGYASKSRRASVPTQFSKPISKKEKSRVEELIEANCSNCKSKTRVVEGARNCGTCATKFVYHCCVCDLTFTAQGEIRQHVMRKHLIHELKKRQQCPKCGKRFAIYNDMCKHRIYCCMERNEEGREVTQTLIERNFKCDQCSYRSKDKSNLTRHMQRLHPKLAEKMRDCFECGKKFKGAERLAKHEVYCGKEPRFACDHCQFKSHVKPKLLVHLHAVHLKLFINETLKCKMCGKESFNVYTHAVHIRNCSVK